MPGPSRPGERGTERRIGEVASTDFRSWVATTSGALTLTGTLNGESVTTAITRSLARLSLEQFGASPPGASLQARPAMGPYICGDCQ